MSYVKMDEIIMLKGQPHGWRYLSAHKVLAMKACIGTTEPTYKARCDGTCL